MLHMLLAASLGLGAVHVRAEDSGFSPQEMDAAKEDPKRFTLDEARVKIVPMGGGPAEPGMPPGTGPSTPGDTLVIIDKIINIGLKLWQVIEANRPVVDIKTAWASAVPEGITHWSQLEGWSAPEGTRYGLQAKNLYGVTVVDARWRVLRTYGGRYRGKGKFLSSVTVVPESVDVAWGYRLSLEASVPGVSNVGSAEDPIASMLAQLNWRISTVLKHSEGRGTYYLLGDGTFREVGGPFHREFHADAAAAAEKGAQSAVR